MPRTRLVWHLFAGWCGLAACVFAACYWLASVELAGLADDAQVRRMADAARALADQLPDVTATPGDTRQLELMRRLAGDVNVGFEILDLDGAPRSLTGEPPPGEAGSGPPSGRNGRREGPGEAAILAEARAGRIGRESRYDAESGQRQLSVAIAYGRDTQAAGILRVTSDATLADAALRRGQTTMLLGFIAAGLLAVTAGYAVAKRSASGLEELADSAEQLADGSLEAAIPTPEIAEISAVATALEVLRDQLVERGRTIGRQGSQQEAVLGSMVEGVIAVDNRHRLLSINRAAAELLGLDPGKVLLRPLQEVVRNPDLRRFALRAIDCQEPIEDDLLMRDGLRDRTILLRGTALRDQRSAKNGAVIVLNDVTHFRHLENVRRDFVANVSHELKTPIASIRGFVETLLDGALDDPGDARRFLGIVARQADRLSSIIEDLLALSRIEQIEEASDLPLEPTLLSDVIAAAIADCQLRAGERSITIKADCDRPVTVPLNPPLLEQALINLIDNAVKYSDPGRTVRVEVTPPPVGEKAMVMIAVHDEGCGIDERFLPRIFERFYRVDRARSRKLGGTGLGLSIVKHIVQAHGGSVAVESTPGVGSVFSIMLPTEPTSMQAAG